MSQPTQFYVPGWSGDEFTRLWRAIGIRITAISTDLLKNKGLEDWTTTIVHALDNTKKVMFDASGISSATTRTWAFPDANDIFVGLDTLQTLANKTLIQPIIGVIQPTLGNFLTLPNTTDTLVGRNTTDTLSNKTIVAPVITSGLALSGDLVQSDATLNTLSADTQINGHLQLASNKNLYLSNGTGAIISSGTSTSSFAGGINVSGSLAAYGFRNPNFTTAGVVHNSIDGEFLSSLIVDADIDSAAAIQDTKLAQIATANKVADSANDSLAAATSLNIASTLVKRDGSGNFVAGTITASITGSASLNVLKAGDTMTGLLTVPNLTINTMGTAGVVHNSAAGVLSSSLIVNDDITNLTITDSKLAQITTANKVADSANTSLTNATSNNTASTIVKRDGSGNFVANTITASITGSASLNVLKAGDSMTGTLNINKASTGPQTCLNLNNTDTSNSSEARLLFSQGSAWLQGITGKYNTNAPFLGFSANQTTNTWNGVTSIWYNGGMSIGASYYSTLPPANGLQVQGSTTLAALTAVGTAAINSTGTAATSIGNSTGGVTIGGNLAMGSQTLTTTGAVSTGSLTATVSGTGPQNCININNSDTGGTTSESRMVFSEGGNWYQGIGGRYNSASPYLSFSANTTANTWKGITSMWYNGGLSIGITNNSQSSPVAPPANGLQVEGSTTLAALTAVGTAAINSTGTASTSIGNSTGGVNLNGVVTSAARIIAQKDLLVQSTKTNITTDATEQAFQIFRTGVSGPNSTLNRWAITHFDAETGSNAGTNFGIYRYDDSGAGLGKVIEFTRSTGDAKFHGNVSVASSKNLTMGTSSTISAVNLTASGTSTLSGITTIRNSQFRIESDTPGADRGSTTSTPFMLIRNHSSAAANPSANRWIWNLYGQESSGNAGSDLILQSRSDDGGIGTNALTITRSNGDSSFGGNVSIASGKNLTLTSGNADIIGRVSIAKTSTMDGNTSANAHLRLQDATTTTKSLHMYWDATFDSNNGAGAIQSLNDNISVRPLNLNPYGGDINLGRTANSNTITLNNNTTIASGKNLTMTTGTGTFSTGTGQVSLNGKTLITPVSNFSSPSNAAGVVFQIGSPSFSINDTTVSPGAIANFAVNSIGQATLTSDNARVYGTASSLYIAGAPIFSTGTSSTVPPYALLIGSGTSRFAGDITQTGSSSTFTTGGGAVSLAGDTTVASGKSLTVVSGTTSLTGTVNINTSGSLTTTIGNSSASIALNGNTTVAAGRVLTTAGTLYCNSQTNAKMIALWDTNPTSQTATNYYGFGIASNTLRYHVISSSASHIFYSDASDLFKINDTAVTSYRDMTIVTGKNLTLSNLTTSNGVLKNSTAGLISSSLIVDANITTNTIANNKLVAEPVSTNTANRIVLRDASGNFAAGTVTTTGLSTGRTTIDADYTTGSTHQLIIRGAGVNSGKRMLMAYDTSDNSGLIQTEDQGNSYTPLYINPLGGAIEIGNTSSGYIDLNCDTTIPSGKNLTLANLTTENGVLTNSTAGLISSSLITNDNIDSAAAIVDTKLAQITTANKVADSSNTSLTNATSNNTVSTLVKRDGSGNFSTTGITATTLNVTNLNTTVTTNSSNYYATCFVHNIGTNLPFISGTGTWASTTWTQDQLPGFYNNSGGLSDNILWRVGINSSGVQPTLDAGTYLLQYNMVGGSYNSTDIYQEQLVDISLNGGSYSQCFDSTQSGGFGHATILLYECSIPIMFPVKLTSASTVTFRFKAKDPWDTTKYVGLTGSCRLCKIY